MTNPGKQKKTPFPEKWKTGNGVEGKNNIFAIFAPSEERKKNKLQIYYTLFFRICQEVEKNFPKGRGKMSKKFYWIKLRTDFFDLETIDWLISQPNGCEYVVLYQKLCLITANKGGELFTEIGEIIIPYDANKIARDTKFPFDTVVVALELFKKTGLIYEQENGVLKIPYVEEVVGSETESAKRVRDYRARKTLQCNNDVTDNVTDVTLQCNAECNIEYRDKSIDIDIRDIDKDTDIEKEIETEKTSDKSDGTPPASKTKKPAKKKYGTYQHIRLTDEEYSRLCEEYSEQVITDYITKMDEWIQLKGNKGYKDYNLAIRKWLSRDNITKTGGIENGNTIIKGINL